MRLVVLLGTVLCCTSCIASAYVKSYITLFLAYGIIGGIGSGLILTPSFIACSLYFDKWKKVASGIAMSGAGFATMFVSLVGNYVNINFGYTGYFAIISLLASLSIVLVIFGFPLQEEKEDCSEESLHPEKLHNEQEWKYERFDFQQEGIFSSITKAFKNDF